MESNLTPIIKESFEQNLSWKTHVSFTYGFFAFFNEDGGSDT